MVWVFPRALLCSQSRVGWPEVSVGSDFLIDSILVLRINKLIVSYVILTSCISLWTPSCFSHTSLLQFRQAGHSLPRLLLPVSTMWAHLHVSAQMSPSGEIFLNLKLTLWHCPSPFPNYFLYRIFRSCNYHNYLFVCFFSPLLPPLEHETMWMDLWLSYLPPYIPASNYIWPEGGT